MLKFLTALALAATFTVCAPSLTSGIAHAQAGMKTCKSKVPSTGKMKTWRCKSDVPCCVSHELGLYVCGSPMIGCL